MNLTAPPTWRQQGGTQFPIAVAGQGARTAIHIRLLPGSRLGRNRHGERPSHRRQGRRHLGAASARPGEPARGNRECGGVLSIGCPRGHDRRGHRRQRRELSAHVMRENCLQGAPSWGLRHPIPIARAISTPCPDGGDSDSPRQRLAGGCETFHADGRRHGRHRIQVHDPDDW